MDSCRTTSDSNIVDLFIFFVKKRNERKKSHLLAKSLLDEITNVSAAK